MDDLKQRQKDVLRVIVSTYVKTVNPVGSRTIAQYYQNEFSPATIRNEMHGLEEKEYISQPHTSAGRIPTDKGYRYFVDHLIPESRVPAHVATLVAREYRERIDNMETLVERTSKILSVFSEQTGFVAFPVFEELTFKRVELTSLGRSRLLVVWVANNGFIQNRVIDMKEEIPETELERISRFLNQELAGRPLAEIESYLTQRLKQASDALRTLYQTASLIVRDSFPKTLERKLSVQGSRYILEQPEFKDWEKSRRLFKLLDSKESLADLCRTKAGSVGVQVQIGSEHHCDDIRDCSLITAEYYINQKSAGMLGILGPRRMQYDQTISLVDFMSRRFGELLEKWL
jgi:heat-inducible transcriptional repressor